MGLTKTKRLSPCSLSTGALLFHSGLHILILLLPLLEAISYIYYSKTAEVSEYLFIIVTSISGQKKKKPFTFKNKNKTNGTI